MVEQFVAGLPPMLSRSVVEREIKYFDEAVRVAAHLQEVNARYFTKSSINTFFSPENHDSSQHRQNGTAPPTTTDSSHREDDSRPMGRGISRGRFTAQRRGNARPSGRSKIHCYRCMEIGHLRRDCPRTSCFICGDFHHTHSCANVVCAQCQQPGHPANRCSKNSKGPPLHTTIS